MRQLAMCTSACTSRAGCSCIRESAPDEADDTQSSMQGMQAGFSYLQWGVISLLGIKLGHNVMAQFVQVHSCAPAKSHRNAADMCSSCSYPSWHLMLQLRCIGLYNCGVVPLTAISKLRHCVLMTGTACWNVSSAASVSAYPYAICEVCC